MLELDGVTKRLGGTLAVDGVSFAVRPGSITGLIGPNGAGKTTLFDVISGFVPPDEGSVLLEGRSIGNLRPHEVCHHGLGRTFQLNAAFATLTVYVPVVTSRETIANVQSTRRLAVVATQPLDHCSTQLKGVAQGTRPAREDEEPFVRRHLGNFGGVLNQLGIPPRVTSTVVHWPAIAIDMRVEEIFDQTPGPKAGTRLQ